MRLASTIYAKSFGFLNKAAVDNPVILKEMRTSIRGWKALTITGFYIGFLSVVFFVAYLIVYMDANFHASSGYGTTYFGDTLFKALVGAQTILLTLVIPSLASGAITGELEKKTIELLALTRLSSGRLVIGKLLSIVIYAFMLLVCSIPFAALCMLFGGVSPAQVAIAYLLILVWVFLLTSVGIYWSSLFKKTTVASLFTYGFAFAHLFPTSIAFAENLYHYGISGRPLWYRLLSPFWASSLGDMQLNTYFRDITLPAMSIPLVVHTFLGTLLLFTAAMNIKYKPTDKGLPIRLLLIGFTTMIAGLFVLDFHEFAHHPSNTQMLTWISVVVMSFLCIAAVLLTTGPFRKPEGVSLMRYLFSGRKAFKSDLGGSFTFMMLWAVVILGVTGLYFAVLLEDFSRSTWTSYGKTAIVTLSIVAAISMIGILMSSIFRRRRDAVTGLVFVFLLGIGAYIAVLLNYLESTRSIPKTLIHLSAIWPLTPFYQEWGYLDDLLRMKPVWGKYAWLITSSFYAVLGIVCLVLALIIQPKRSGVREEEL